MSRINKIIFGVVAILLAIVIYFLLTYKESSFNRIKITETNGVLNRTEDLYLDTIVHVGLKELNISGISVLINPLEKKLMSGEYDIQAHIVGNTNQFIIFTKSFNRRKAIEVISHELIHLEQYRTERLIKLGSTVVWEGVPYPLIGLLPYLDRPWEVEAFVLGEELKDKIDKILIKR